MLEIQAYVQHGHNDTKDDFCSNLSLSEDVRKVIFRIKGFQSQSMLKKMQKLK